MDSSGSPLDGGTTPHRKYRAVYLVNMPIFDFAAKKAIVLAPRRAQLCVLLRCDETILNLIFPFRHSPPLQTIPEMSGHNCLSTVGFT